MHTNSKVYSIFFDEICCFLLQQRICINFFNLKMQKKKYIDYDHRLKYWAFLFRSRQFNFLFNANASNDNRTALLYAYLFFDWTFNRHA